uniref:Dynein light chain roadblock n=1 Tax=Strombidium rassoulzadegani TaxID=1082188 RepID=A0A7S3CW28_9SPIT|mmetsp:Transcript_8903/g.15100  ORF Transcript_8903/g.15100 Transcript_8903/m.15100 type:complete len:103 (+) Transcript_8903:35-343(+)
MAEVEERIARIKKHKGVVGVLIVDENGKFLRSSIPPESEVQSKQYALKVTDLAKKARSVVRDIDPLNDLTFFRVRSKKQEIMVAPDKNLFLIVIQDQIHDQE